MQINALMCDKDGGNDCIKKVVILAFLADSDGTPVAVYYDSKTMEISYEYVDRFKIDN
jgi:hypothetical protein